jgi:hypothetical protein
MRSRLARAVRYVLLDLYRTYVLYGPASDSEARRAARLCALLRIPKQAVAIPKKARFALFGFAKGLVLWISLRGIPILRVGMLKIGPPGPRPTAPRLRLETVERTVAVSDVGPADARHAGSFWVGVPSGRGCASAGSRACASGLLGQLHAETVEGERCACGSTRHPASRIRSSVPHARAGPGLHPLTFKRL